MADQFEVPEIKRLWTGWNVVMEMMKNRKYNVPDENFVTYEEFIDWVGDNADEARKTMQYIFEDRNMGIFWTESLGQSDLQNIIELLQSNSTTKAIVIHKNKVTPHAAANLRGLKVQGISIETFSEAEVQYDPTKHEYVPQHIICSTKTKEEVMAAYAITKEQIPKILTTDPIVRYYGCVKGQLIKIVRVSDSIPEIEDPNTGEKKVLYDISYRIVS